MQHTPAGGSIWVRVRHDGDSRRVVLEVRDDGAGISAELLPHVFERFARAADLVGSGLGLAIARDVVTAHGGDIDIQSSPGSGTTVRLSLPVGFYPCRRGGAPRQRLGLTLQPCALVGIGRPS